MLVHRHFVLFLLRCKKWKFVRTRKWTTIDIKCSDLLRSGRDLLGAAGRLIAPACWVMRESITSGIDNVEPSGRLPYASASFVYRSLRMEPSEE